MDTWNYSKEDIIANFSEHNNAQMEFDGDATIIIASTLKKDKISGILSKDNYNFRSTESYKIEVIGSALSRNSMPFIYPGFLVHPTEREYLYYGGVKYSYIFTPKKHGSEKIGILFSKLQLQTQQQTVQIYSFSIRAIASEKYVKMDEVNIITGNNTFIGGVDCAELSISGNVDMRLYDINNIGGIKATTVKIGEYMFSALPGKIICDVNFMALGDIKAQNYESEGNFYNNGVQAIFCNHVMIVNKDTNSIFSNTNASIYGINEITCTQLNYTTLSPPVASIIQIGALQTEINELRAEINTLRTEINDLQISNNNNVLLFSSLQEQIVNLQLIIENINITNATALQTEVSTLNNALQISNNNNMLLSSAIQEQVAILQTTTESISISNATTYIQALQGFFEHFQESIYIMDDSLSTEFDYTKLIAGISNYDSANIQAYFILIKSFILNFQASIYISDELGNEFDYSVIISTVDINIFIIEMRKFFNNFKENIFLEDKTHAEIDYSKLI
jgi:hypothetical protein